MHLSGAYLRTFPLSQRKVPKEGDHGQSKPFDAYSHAYPQVLDLGTARGPGHRAFGVPVCGVEGLIL